MTSNHVLDTLRRSGYNVCIVRIVDVDTSATPGVAYTAGI
jgi:hypothetical protein